MIVKFTFYCSHFLLWGRIAAPYKASIFGFLTAAYNLIPPATQKAILGPFCGPYITKGAASAERNKHTNGGGALPIFNHSGGNYLSLGGGGGYTAADRPRIETPENDFSVQPHINPCPIVSSIVLAAILRAKKRFLILSYWHTKNAR